MAAYRPSHITPATNVPANYERNLSQAFADGPLTGKISILRPDPRVPNQYVSDRPQQRNFALSQGQLTLSADLVGGAAYVPLTLGSAIERMWALEYSHPVSPQESYKIRLDYNPKPNGALTLSIKKISAGQAEALTAFGDLQRA
jgi:dipeptidyl aminopeptidase/acylaminoacyl peptidase